MAFEDQLRQIVGAVGMIEGADMAPYLTDWRGRVRGDARAVVRPGTTEEVSAVMRLCQAERIPVQPQGGNTGVAVGSIPQPGGTGIVLSLGRMRGLRQLDATGNVVVVDAGMTLADLHDHAEGAGRVFGLRLGSEGTAQIGGLISTNAGGTAAVRYGVMRDLVLGVEAVLPDGSVVRRLGGLRKDNRGYDWKHLFIGGEGTLGVVTAAALKLHPKPMSGADAVCGLASPEAAVALFAAARARFGDRIDAFELLSASEVDVALAHVPGLRRPIASCPPWSVMIALSAPDADAGLDTALNGFLEAQLDAGGITDAMLPQSVGDSRAIWALRHAVAEAHKLAGHSITFDISVPVSRIPDFIVAAGARTHSIAPDATPIVLSHLGDGNVHWIVLFPHAVLARGIDVDGLTARLFEAIHQVAQDLDGSFSAEHGIGRKLSAEIATRLDPAELALMRSLKAALDPAGLMAPGVLLD